jgi:hypothetical protein
VNSNCPEHKLSGRRDLQRFQISQAAIIDEPSTAMSLIQCYGTSTAALGASAGN